MHERLREPGQALVSVFHGPSRPHRLSARLVNWWGALRGLSMLNGWFCLLAKTAMVDDCVHLAVYQPPQDD